MSNEDSILTNEIARRIIQGMLDNNERAIDIIKKNDPAFGKSNDRISIWNEYMHYCKPIRHLILPFFSDLKTKDFVSKFQNDDNYADNAYFHDFCVVLDDLTRTAFMNKDKKDSVYEEILDLPDINNVDAYLDYINGTIMCYLDCKNKLLMVFRLNSAEKEEEDRLIKYNFSISYIAIDRVIDKLK